MEGRDLSVVAALRFRISDIFVLHGKVEGKSVWDEMIFIRSQFSFHEWFITYLIELVHTIYQPVNLQDLNFTLKDCILVHHMSLCDAVERLQ